MSTADMKAQANFTSANGNANPSWDFTNAWEMSDGAYPQLRNVPAAL